MECISKFKKVIEELNMCTNFGNEFSCECREIYNNVYQYTIYWVGRKVYCFEDDSINNNDLKIEHIISNIAGEIGDLVKDGKDIINNIRRGTNEERFDISH